jgi:O-antigen ligase
VAAGALAAVAGGLRTEPGTSVAALPVLLAAMAGCALAARAVRADGPVTWLRTAALGATVLVLAGTIAAMISTERVPGRDVPEAGPQRLASVQSNRYAYWKVAVEAFADHPLNGEGSGGFRAAWLREREFRESVRDAHSLYLETAAELGLAGLLALGLLVAGCALAAVRAGPPAAGSVAALAAFALHAGIDWDWELPALTLVALALAASLIATQEDAGARDARAP